MLDKEIKKRYRTELEIGAVEIQLIVYPRKLTDRASAKALIAAQADVLIEFAAHLAGQAMGE